MNSVDPKFAWLIDAPLFIDTRQVERFYDAVTRPAYIEGSTSILTASSEEGALTTKLAVEGKLGFGGGFLKYLIGATAETKLGAEIGETSKKGSTDSSQTQWIPNRSPQLQLEQLIMTYHELLPQRLLSLGRANFGPILEPKVVSELPRALVVLDLPGKAEAEGSKVDSTCFIPMAAELEKGKIVLLYEQLSPKSADSQDSPSAADPSLPKAASPKTQQQQDRWERIIKNFDPWDAMKVVEDAAADSRIRWIDFRIPLTHASQKRTIHLHICPEGDYDTGVFAYNLIQRGFKFGVRLVGTLKAGSDINVLAIYEK